MMHRMSQQSPRAAAPGRSKQGPILSEGQLQHSAIGELT